MTGLSLYNFKSNFLDLEKDVIWVFWRDVLYDGNCFEEEQEERKIKIKNKTKFVIDLCFIDLIIEKLWIYFRLLWKDSSNLIISFIFSEKVCKSII